MSKHKDEYRDDEPESSQVRSIIRRINEETPGQERSREVVVREDGTKAVRVTKKRKVMLSKAETRRRSRRSFMVTLFALLLVFVAVVAFFFFRMSVMSGSSYLAEREQELARLWGANSVECRGTSLEGFELRAERILVSFPESSTIESVELNGVKGVLNVSTFFTGVFTGEELNIDRVNVRLRANARTVSFPVAQDGEELLKFDRIRCAKLSVSLGDAADSPWALKNCSAYLYHPRQDASVVILEGGAMSMKGWKDMMVMESKVLFSSGELESFSLCCAPPEDETSKKVTRSVTISGSLADGDALAGPFDVVADNMPMDTFTQGRFKSFFSGNAVKPPVRLATPTAKVVLPLEAEYPVFSGSFNMRGVMLAGLPGIELLQRHLDSLKRERYVKLLFASATVRLSCESGEMCMEFDETEMGERNYLALRGRICVNDDTILSGKLDYGLPVDVARSEYSDGKADPIFTEDARTAWLCTELCGTAAKPQDNSGVIDEQAAASRKGRPSRSALYDDRDVEKIAEKLGVKADEPKAAASESTETTPSGGGLHSLDGGLDPLNPDPFAEPF